MPAACHTLPPPSRKPAGGAPPSSLAVLTLQAFKGVLLVHPTLWQLLWVVAAPLRATVLLHLWAGRSLRSLAAELLHRLLLAAGWLSARVEPRRLRGFEREFFPLRRWHLAVGALALARGVLAARAAWREAASGRAARRRELLRRMRGAQNFDEWSGAAVELEALQGLDPRARWALESRLYDRRLLQERLAYLRAVREAGDVGEVMFGVRSDLVRNLGNITNAELHEHFPVVPEPIRAYIEEVQRCLKAITGSPDLLLDDKLNFLRETRHAFGRTGLVLSGGGSFGAFHMGVVKALHDAGLLPRIVSGSSAGGIVAAIICTRTEQELNAMMGSLPEIEGIDFYSSSTFSQVIRHLLLKGTLQDHVVLQERLRRMMGDMTFAEAYQRSGRVLNISITAADTSEPPRLLNYLTAPNVLVWSAVACSSAFPFLYAPQTLMARDSAGRVVSFATQTAGELQRRWRDGSLEEDLPMRGLSEMFNVNYFLVSQANPYLLPIIAGKRLLPRALGGLVEGEFKHRCKQLMDVLPHWAGASRLLKLVNQPWEGDCTMTMPATTFGTAKAVINLSKADLLLALAEGRRATWAKLSAIQSNCAVEATIDECLRQVTAMSKAARVRAARRGLRAAAAAGGGGAGGMQRGLPSWVHMPALLPRVSSAEGMTPRGGSLEGLVHHSHSYDALRGGGSMELPGRFGTSLPERFFYPPRRAGSAQSVPQQLAVQQAAGAAEQAPPPGAGAPPPGAEAAREGGGGAGEGGAGLAARAAEAYLATAAAVAAEGGVGVPPSPRVLGSASGSGGLVEDEDVGEEEPIAEEGAESPAAAPALTAGRDLWREFFAVTPATTAGPSQSLDYIAP